MFSILFVFFISVIILKFYFRGKQCKITKNLQGYSAIVTGGNTGIGSFVVRKLAQFGCHVIIAARDKKKSEILINQVKKQIINSQIQYIELDLSNKKSIEQFCLIIKTRFQKIDFLINNAGLLAPNKSITADGIQMQIAVNYLGHYYLTYLLWSLIKNSAQARIINTSSTIHKTVKFNPQFEYNKKNSNSQRYSQSKLALILFTKELAKRNINSRNIKVVSLHPGIVNTEITRDFNFVIRFLYKLAQPVIWIFFRDCKQGAQTTLFCSLEQFEKIKSGAYYDNCKEQSPSRQACNEQNQKRLWQLSEKYLNIKWIL